MPVVIICPSCDARFSVLEDLIPKAGRLMRCNNCGHRWHGVMQEPAQSKSKRFTNKKPPPPKTDTPSRHDDDEFEAWDVPRRSVRVAAVSFVRRVIAKINNFFSAIQRLILNLWRLVWRVLRFPFDIMKRLLRLTLRLAILGAIAFGVLRLSCYGRTYVPPDMQGIFAQGCSLSKHSEKIMMPYVTKATRVARNYGRAYLPSREINMMSEFFSKSLSELPESLPFLEEEPAERQRPSEPVVRRGR